MIQLAGYESQTERPRRPSLRERFTKFYWRCRWRFQRENDICRAAKRASRGSDVIAKAACDYFEYVLQTRGGVLFSFTELDVRGEWVLLKDAEILQPHVRLQVADRIPLRRGVELRLSEIAWIADGGK